MTKILLITFGTTIVMLLFFGCLAYAYDKNKK